MSLTIVITTYNRVTVLKVLLERLNAQSDQNFQVVVAVDGSTDNTEQMLQGIETSYSLKWVNTHCESYGLAMARNMGILEADNEAIAILDDDCFPCPGYVAALKRSVRSRTITGGPRTPASTLDSRQVEKMRELDRLPDCEPLAFSRIRREWPKAAITECNICAYKRDLVDLGLFSERLKIYGFIGQEFFARAEHFGYAYQYNREAEIVHHRQKDGDNELSLKRKRIQIMMATALRPALMNPTQYAIQSEWAKRMSERYPATCKLPGLPASAWLGFPYRFIRNRAGDLRRRLRDARHQNA
ncbi:glycosyltransferase family 2 protein [Dokdonella immobilis]|uniref:Glycosyltransferase involved in cell wall bisynthesis n=1 Tax=Dokdonella immobilis TaxID=578942 RepID=A0A1I4Y0W2_9GAMM|nr:glycosyltransferase family 2 protein [Dokdonella immobilis]SFN31702.1 Glycosyltransferase involved in cell wall bisynthesis [Dokdonella immobilis]